MVFLDNTNKNSNWAKKTYDLPFVNTIEKYLSHFGITDMNKLKTHISESQDSGFWIGVPQKFKDVLLDNEKMANLLAK